MGVSSLGSRVDVLRFRVQGLGFRVQGLRVRIESAGCRAQGSGCRVEGAGEVEIGTSQRKNGTSGDLGNSGEPEKLDGRRDRLLKGDAVVAEMPHALGLRVQGLGLVKSWGLGLGLVQRLGSQGLGFKVLGLGFRV